MMRSNSTRVRANGKCLLSKSRILRSPANRLASFSLVITRRSWAGANTKATENRTRFGSNVARAPERLRLLHAHVARLVGHALLPGAPAGIHAKGTALQ